MARAVTVELKARDQRFLRAAGDVLKRYRMKRCETSTPDEPVCVEVKGGDEDYVVTVNPNWAWSPACTCPDARRLARQQNAGYCKHIIAVLLQEKDLQHQLLELLL